MHFFKYNILFILFLFSNFTYADSFSDMDCFSSDFEVSVSHKVKPFGMFENVIALTKNRCVITIETERFKFMKDRWIIDICREPIHIKSGTGAIDVSKKINDCIGVNSKKSYCRYLKDIFQRIEDDGLIFADGERENLNTDHGKYFCSYLLIKSYLEEGHVFSRSGHYENILSNPIRSFSNKDLVVGNRTVHARGVENNINKVIPDSEENTINVEQPATYQEEL